MSGRIPALLAAACLSGCLEPGDPWLSARDLDPPEFLSVDPPEGSPIARTAEILVTFSERMDPASLRPGILLRVGERRHPVVIVYPVPDTPDAVEQQDRPWTVSVTPETPLWGDTVHHLVLQDVLTDTAGNRFAPDGISGGELTIEYRTTP